MNRELKSIKTNYNQNLEPDLNEDLEKEENWLEKKVFKIVP